ncbi:hypothetical protein YYG_01912 [Plasmodium vinckei petteri]|uniref:Fam-d protein n=1 Tax=Plasmodium vinckei petteri TaxID=138298 RepID=W7AHK6_PLAVN|nr:hypothetical protein YYG_01912 [Plasmodium vinckei petteri]
MMNIILSFFIFVIFSNVKAATFQGTNNNRPKSAGCISVAQPMAIFSSVAYDDIQRLDKINNFLSGESKNIKYFIVSIDNSSPYLNRSISKNRIEELQTGTRYFTTYIKVNIKHLFSRYMHKYNFENNYGDNLNRLAKDLKTLMYEQFDAKFEQDLIRYENEPKIKDSVIVQSNIFIRLISEKNANVAHDFKIPILNVVRLVANISGKS